MGRHLENGGQKWPSFDSGKVKGLCTGDAVWTILHHPMPYPRVSDIRVAWPFLTEIWKKWLNGWRGVPVEKMTRLVREIPYLETRTEKLHTLKNFFCFPDLIRLYPPAHSVWCSAHQLRASGDRIQGRSKNFDFGGSFSVKIFARDFDPKECPDIIPKNIWVSAWHRGGGAAKN